jgi:arabinan endo-1,5-alpha-L-arabinosidase
MTEPRLGSLEGAMTSKRFLFLVPSALALLTTATPACTGSESAHPPATYRNPVFAHDAPDPSIIRASDGYFYVYTTQSIYPAGVLNLPILQSPDLVHWKLVGQVFDQIPRWVVGGPGGDMWAPHAVGFGGRYYVYYAGREYGTGQMAIGVATSDSPTGPFHDLGKPLISGYRPYVAIDPFAFQAANGRKYLYWGSNFDPIRVQRLSADGLSLVGQPKVALAPRPSDNGGLIEGAWVLPHDGLYYLMYSQGDCCSSHANYQIGVARALSPTGPFTRDPDNPILAGNAHFTAPGHNATITDDTGQDWIVYHSRTHGNLVQDRDLMLDRILWKNGWPAINDGKGPSWMPQPVPVVHPTKVPASVSP